MPELPEVESVSRGLRRLEGRVIRALSVRDRTLWFESELSPEDFRSLRLQKISRRGKYLVFSFEKGRHLVVHLRMTGKILPLDSEAIPDKIRAERETTLQLRCRMDWEGGTLFFYDTRRFGTFTALKNLEAYWERKMIAPDPLLQETEALPHFLDALAKSGRPAKSALLDQSVIAGVGNIYADEALFRCGIHPKRKARLIKDKQALFHAIRRLLQEAIAANGTSILNYVDAEGRSGGFAEKLQAYGRDGEPCIVCRAPIRKITLAGRSTHFCKNCQR